MEDLIETDRMTYFGELIGKMAHEINNPLAIIVGKAEGLLSHSEQENFDKELFVSHLMKIIQTSNRISHIIKQIGP